MRKIIACEFITLDGVIQSDPADGFEYSGWFFGYTDEECGAVIQERLGKEVDLLLGRKTFDIWEPYWPTHAPGRDARSRNRCADHGRDFQRSSIDGQQWLIQSRPFRSFEHSSA